MSELYPLKFTPILKDKIWGGTKLKDVLNKESKSKLIGESWEISGVEGDISVVSNGFLAGNNLQELIEIYMGELVGDTIYDKFGIEFPLLTKFIDAQDKLSIQVHPDDKMAMERHNAFGKSEMWYVVDADEGADIIIGFNQKVDKAKYLDTFYKLKLPEILNNFKIKTGDSFFIPAGRIHAIMKGTLIAEIQQTSDITYRIYDWDRIDEKGNSRDLHIDLAIDAIDFKDTESPKLDYTLQTNKTSNLKRCNYFTTNILEFDQPLKRDYFLLDSFVIYMCLEGDFSIEYNEGSTIQISKGESVLIPNDLNELVINPKTKAKILEIYIEDKI